MHRWNIKWKSYPPQSCKDCHHTMQWSLSSSTRDSSPSRNVNVRILGIRRLCGGTLYHITYSRTDIDGWFGARMEILFLAYHANSIRGFLDSIHLISFTVFSIHSGRDKCLRRQKVQCNAFGKLDTSPTADTYLEQSPSDHHHGLLGPSS